MPSLFGLLAILAVPTLLVTQWLWPLYRNYRAAQKIGLPVLVAPFNPENFLYMLFKVSLRPYLKKIIPTDGLEVSVFGWQFRTRRESMHQRYGNIFLVATPGQNEIWCADPAMAQVILTRRKDFVQSPIAALIMRFQGENILTSNGETWARQRRLVAPNLNERISQVVWTESMCQANQMVDFMLRQPGSSSRDTISGLRSIAINVLGQVGYGQPKPFKPMELPRDPQARMSYIDAISLTTELIIFAALAPAWLLRLSFMPLPIQTLGAAVTRLPGLTRDMLQSERQRAASGSETHDNMMSMLVRLSDSEKSGGIPDGQSGQFLKDDEIAGNLFVFTAAGFDTTANTMSYAITLLAAYPEWQQWIQEEIDFVWRGVGKDDEAPDYSTVFPQLTRTLAVMFETLRLFPPLQHVSRATVTSQTITTSTGTYHLEGQWKVFPNIMGLHYDPNTWGPDYADFRPSRWLASGSSLGDSTLVTPVRGTFSPWSGGPRVCPGMKMSQVEFVTVMTTLFRRCRIDPAVQQGQDLHEARRNLIKLTDDSMQKLTMQMNKPRELNLKWTLR